MKIELSRADAIKAIQLHSLLYLSIEEKGNILIDEGIENVGNEDEGWDQNEISKYKNNSLIMDQFYLNSLVTNEYMKIIMSKIYNVEVKIIDQPSEIPASVKCVCCGYKTAFVGTDIDICPVCDWQDVYIENEEKYSSANHSSLKDYRENFQSKADKNPDDVKYKKFSK